MLPLVAMLRLFPSLLVGFALAVGCGGSSTNFDDPAGGAGDPGVGGSSGGSDPSGGAGPQGGSYPSGGDAGTAPTGGASGSPTGGLAGVGETGGTSAGGTDTGGNAGEGATGGSTGGVAGTTGGLGGTAGSRTGGTGGQVGGFGGVGGMVDSRCPFRPPTGECTPNGLSCRYDLARMCLCMTSTSPYLCTTVDPRCTQMAGAPPPNGDRIVAAIQTCDCTGGTWFCHIP